MFIGELLDGLDVLVIQLNLLEVLSNSSRGDGLGNDGVSANLTPGKNDLCWSGALLFGDGLDLWTCDEERDVEEVCLVGESWLSCCLRSKPGGW